MLLFMTIPLLFSCLKEGDFRTWDIEVNELQDYLEDNQITTEPTWTGLYYIENEEGTGILAEKYDTVSFEFVASDVTGKVISSTDPLSEPSSYILGDANIIHGLNEAISFMKVGGKSTAIIPSYIGFGAGQNGDVDPYTTLIYDINLLEVKPGYIVEPFNTDSLLINTTYSGLEYYIVEEDSSTMVQSGNTIYVHYTGYTSDGKIFDSSVKRGTPSTFRIGVGELIKGWDEGLLLMSEGDKFRFIVPSDLAYGESGSFPIIPPDEALTFDVEVIEILY